MFCSACGQQLPDGSGYCGRCGARFAVPGRGSSVGPVAPLFSAAGTGHAGARTQPSAAIFLVRATAVIVVLAIVGLIFFRYESAIKPPETHTESNPAHVDGGSINAKPTKAYDAPNGSEEKFLNDARKTAREKYISDMHDLFFDNGFDASIRDDNGQLVITSDTFKLKTDRDYIMRQTFPAATRRKFCEIGFKTVNLRSGVFSDSHVYSMGCPETKEEKEMRLQQERAARQRFINNVQNGFNNDPYTKELQIADINNELVITYPPSKYTSPAQFRDMMAASLSTENLCKIGFKGIRVRAGAKSAGTFTSFGCRNVATQ
jgi:hypothetical protein